MLVLLIDDSVDIIHVLKFILNTSFMCFCLGPLKCLFNVDLYLFVHRAYVRVRVRARYICAGDRDYTDSAPSANVRTNSGEPLH